EDAALGTVYRIASALDDATGGLFAVADGMGGGEHGETASKTVLECLTGAPAGGLTVPRLASLAEAQTWFSAVATEARARIIAQFGTANINVGSTMVAALVQGTEVLVANV